MNNNEYRLWMIEEILKEAPERFTEEQLSRKSIRSLEKIYDHLMD